MTTTLPRFQAVRPLAEKLITKARKGDLHAKRTVMRTIPNRDAVVKLFDDVAPVTPTVRVATPESPNSARRGDGAEEAVIELV